MSKLLIGSIDLNKIDKSQIVDKDKNGQPFKNGAKYINVSVWVNNEPDQYGNHASISMGGKENKTYIGNLKEFQKAENIQVNDADEIKTDGDLPF